MTQDALKSLLLAPDHLGEPAPARDLTFTVGVMKRIEQKRLAEGLAWLAAGVIAVTLILALIMPYITPAIVVAARPLLPVFAALTVVGVLFAMWKQIAPVLRDYGLGV